MRLHSDTITSHTVWEVMQRLRKEDKITGVWHEATTTGSRSRKYGLNLKLTADPRKGRRRFTNSGYAGANGEDYAATWDEWGIVLQALYDLDPNLTSDYYADREHYEWATGGRFVDGGPAETHDNHQWKWDGGAATRSYSVSTCSKCGAVKRHLGKHGPGFESAFGRTWGERIPSGVTA